MTPSRNDAVTIPCPVCASPFVASGKRRYCGDACRVAAHRRRHRVVEQPVTLPPPGEPRRLRTVYQCSSCDGRAVGEQRCPECAIFMRRLGPGGLCPCCDEPITVDELLGP